jgi:hypothetical protein
MQYDVSISLAKALTACGLYAEHLELGIITTEVALVRDGRDGTVRLHVHKDGALVTLAVTFYEDDDDKEVGTFPVSDVANILTAIASLT